MILLYPIILIALCTRYIQWRLFMKKVSKICYQYDKSYVFGKDHIPELIAKMKDPDGYYVYSEWSAYYFLFLQGPDPYAILISLKAYRLENFYSATSIDKLRAMKVYE